MCLPGGDLFVWCKLKVDTQYYGNTKEFSFSNLLRRMTTLVVSNLVRNTLVKIKVSRISTLFQDDLVWSSSWIHKISDYISCLFSIPALLNDLTWWLDRFFFSQSSGFLYVQVHCALCSWWMSQSEKQEAIWMTVQWYSLSDFQKFWIDLPVLPQATGQTLLPRATFRPGVEKHWKPMCFSVVEKEQPAKMTGWGKLQSDICGHSGGHSESTETYSWWSVKEKLKKFEVSFRFGSIPSLKRTACPLTMVVSNRNIKYSPIFSYIVLYCTIMYYFQGQAVIFRQGNRLTFGEFEAETFAGGAALHLHAVGGRFRKQRFVSQVTGCI